VPARKSTPAAPENPGPGFLRRRAVIQNTLILTSSQQVTAIQKGQCAVGTAPENSTGETEEHTGDSPAHLPDSTIYAYNEDDSKTPGGLKVRWKVRVITGPAAAAYDARQNAAIKELLQWACQQPRRR
jgi:hypothetical protein